MEREKIVCFHLLNDFSGSPRILSQVINNWVNQGYDIDLYTSDNSSEGFLSNIQGINSQYFFYRRSKFKLITLLYLIISQISLMFRLIKYKNENVIFYINTVLPFGAAIMGYVLEKRVVYHIHETSIKPKIFKHFLFSIANYCADEAIYVSNFLLEEERLESVKCSVVYNSLSIDFLNEVKSSLRSESKDFTVLMLSSLKKYKGINEFVELAVKMPSIKYNLVLNGCQTDIEEYFQKVILPENLTLYDAQSDVQPFYQNASLVLNLSHPKKWIETFGLTALEAMSYSIPVIVPTVGGIAELVEDDYCGYKIDVHNTDQLLSTILNLSSNQTLYNRLSEGAYANSKKFDPIAMSQQVSSIIFS